MRFESRICTAPACALRFPVTEGTGLGDLCPLCRAPTRVDVAGYETHSVRKTALPEGPALELVLDSVRSIRNVGSILRTADAMGVRHVHLGGITPTPAHASMKKTSLGAELAVSWSHDPDAVQIIERIASAGTCVVAIESTEGSIPLPAFNAAAALGSRACALVFGHEVSGVDPRALALAEHVVHVPMHGIKGSLNVSVAVGVVLYALRHHG